MEIGDLELPRKMRDTVSETLALPIKKRTLLRHSNNPDNNLQLFFLAFLCDLCGFAVNLSKE